MVKKNPEKQLISIQLNFYDRKALVRIRPGHSNIPIILSEENMEFLGDLIMHNCKYTRMKDTQYIEEGARMLLPTISGQRLENFVRQYFKIRKSEEGIEYISKR